MRGKTVSPELYHPWVRRFYCPDYHKDQDKIVQPTENGIEVGGRYIIQSYLKQNDYPGICPKMEITLMQPSNSVYFLFSHPEFTDIMP